MATKTGSPQGLNKEACQSQRALEQQLIVLGYSIVFAIQGAVRSS
jgi:hypothetical protein